MNDHQRPLPPNWAWTTLGIVAEVRLGKMLSPKAYEEGLTQLPYLRNENVRWGHIDFTDVKLMGFKSEELARYHDADGRKAVLDALVALPAGQRALLVAAQKVEPDAVWD